MANIVNLTKNESLDQTRERINRQFNELNQDIKNTDQRVNTILTGNSETKDPELTDIHYPDPVYTPARPIETAGDIVRDMQKQFSEQLADKAKKVEYFNTEYFNQRGNTSPKLIQNTLGTYFITTQRPNKKGYVRFRMRENVVTTNESVGGAGEFLRCVEVAEVVESFLMTNQPILKTPSENFGISNIMYRHTGIGEQSIPCTTTATRAVGNKVEYEVTTPKNVREVEALIYKTSGASANVDIAVDGVVVLPAQSFVSATSKWERIKIPLPTSGKHTVSLTTNDVANLTIGGLNVVDLRDYVEGYTYDFAVNINNSNTNKYVASNGSMDYALLDADTNLWCGSYHGGETRSKFDLILDGIITTLTDGQFAIANVIDIEQETNIINKIDTFSKQRWQCDGELELQVIFNGSINLKTLFVNMSTTLDTYTDVLYPLLDDMGDKERVTLPEGCNYVIQRNPTNQQMCITILNNNKLGSSELPFIKKTVGAYNKVYNSNIQSTDGILFTGGSFRVSHIFS